MSEGQSLYESIMEAAGDCGLDTSARGAAGRLARQACAEVWRDAERVWEAETDLVAMRQRHGHDAYYGDLVQGIVNGYVLPGLDASEAELRGCAERVRGDVSMLADDLQAAVAATSAGRLYRAEGLVEAVDLGGGVFGQGMSVAAYRDACDWQVALTAPVRVRYGALTLIDPLDPATVHMGRTTALTAEGELVPGADLKVDLLLGRHAGRTAYGIALATGATPSPPDETTVAACRRWLRDLDARLAEVERVTADIRDRIDDAVWLGNPDARPAREPYLGCGIEVRPVMEPHRTLPPTRWHR